ncbi:Hypothetical protein, putative [Bodo saltans]|uniref:Uncharacterized protein n=1 Tax=Bodo saltans TaxID=75058 RepID=A0A0S4J4F6_BODSA|nr:Hypothetical protein, putative [Bodo saltans]|eukprot:CUG86298.1 Hypothetical protein, putative [Bodo saltans]
MSLDRAVVSIRLKLRIHDLPHTSKDDIRTFMQRLEHVELGFCDMQMVTSTVDSKLAQLGVPQVDYRVLHRMIDPNTSQEELVDVDDGYWGLLVRDAVQQHNNHNNGEPMIELMVRVGSTSSPRVALRADATDFADRSSSGGLTRDALHNNNHHTTVFQRPYEHHQQHLSSSVSADVALRVADLLDQPPYSQFHVVGVVGEIRLKRHPILEAEILDEQDPTARITLVCFDEAITNDLRRTLRGNATERVEIRGVGVARKTPKDIQYQSNRHPMLLRVGTSGFSVKVVGYIPGGLAVHNSSNNGTDSTAVLRPQVVDVAPRRTVASLGAAAGGASSAGTTTFLSLKTLRPGPASNSSVSGSGASVGSGGSGGSNTGQSSGGRTMLNLTGGLPRPGGLHPSMQQGSSSSSSSSAKAAVAPYHFFFYDQAASTPPINKGLRQRALLRPKLPLHPTKNKGCHR